MTLYRYSELLPSQPFLVFAICHQYNSWYSFASIRFQLMKRGMDLFYASIGKALELTRGQQEGQDASHESTDTKPSNLWTYVVASLAATYYNGEQVLLSHANGGNVEKKILTAAIILVLYPLLLHSHWASSQVSTGHSKCSGCPICDTKCMGSSLFASYQKGFVGGDSYIERSIHCG